MAWIAPVVGAAASLLGGSQNASAVEATNAQNIELARDEMTWQTTMSNTAEQRHVQDLQAAGLNPALAYGTPAPVPGQAPLPQVNAPQPGAGVIAAGQTAAQIPSMMAQVQLANAQSAQAQAQARNANASAAATEATNQYAGATAQANLANTQAQLKVLQESALNLDRDWAIKDANAQILQGNADFNRQLLGLQLQLQKYEVMQSQLGISKAQADSDFFGTPWGKKVAPFLSNGAGAIGSLAHGASSVLPWVLP